jgi:hypothetical protein
LLGGPLSEGVQALGFWTAALKWEHFKLHAGYHVVHPQQIIKILLPPCCVLCVFRFPEQ